MQINVSENSSFNAIRDPRPGELTAGDLACTWIQPNTIPYDPFTPVEPYVSRVWPDASSTITLTGLTPNNWRFKEHKKSCRLSRDLPGVRGNAIDLSYNDGVVSLSARRFDTNDLVSDSYALGKDYDPDTFKATLESGVLTITVRKIPGKGARQITVEEK